MPSFSELTCTGALAAVDRLVAAHGADGRPWRLVGSSMGGWLVARWAELHPRLADRLVLLCPGFDLASRWPALLGPEKMREWEATGWLALPDTHGRPTPVHWEFYRDSLAHPAWPEVPCPTLILHGRRDEVVPVESSRRYARTRSHVRLVELDDDHGLVASSEAIAAETLRLFGLPDPR